MVLLSPEKTDMPKVINIVETSDTQSAIVFLGDGTFYFTELIHCFWVYKKQTVLLSMNR